MDYVRSHPFEATGRVLDAGTDAYAGASRSNFNNNVNMYSHFNERNGGSMSHFEVVNRAFDNMHPD